MKKKLLLGFLLLVSIFLKGIIQENFLNEKDIIVHPNYGQTVEKIPLQSNSNFGSLFWEGHKPGSSAVQIKESYYFQKLFHYYGFNEDNHICTIIASQILLGYYDTFQDDNIVDEMFEINGGTRSKTKNLAEFLTSPGTGKYDEDSNQSDQRFRDLLIETGIEANNKDPRGNGYYTDEQVNLIKKYLDSKKVTYKINFYQGTTEELKVNKIVNLIKSTIQSGRPIIVNGAEHSAVAYAYDETYVYVNDGLGHFGAVLWSAYTNTQSTTNYDIGAIDIEFTSSHHHSDNYYSPYYDEYYCPCGKVFTKNSINPEDYGYEEAYYSNTTSREVLAGTLSILTNRKRCGYIENEYINLSSRKENVNEAFLEYHLDCNVKKIEVNISFWSAKELFLKGTSSASIDILNENGEWVKMLDLLNDVILSTDRYNQNTVILNLPNNIKSFRFYASNLPIGDRNKGRISIGHLTITHE
ncbi:MAG: C39 family peptidase [Anaeroplasmataceae bacterium]|nr:C39 family peptidase [Anaeroplasmataceae bacterium]